MTYISTFARPLSPLDIEQIGERSGRRNAADGVTGVLMTLGSVFFQIIEGADDAIDDLYARVLRDDRHTNIICLRSEPDIADRLFPDWSMNVFDLDQIGGEVVEPLKIVLDRMSEAQHIIERYTQPAVSRIMRQGLNPLDVPLRNVDRLVVFTDMVAFSAISERLPIEEVSELVTAYLEACSAAIAEHGGEVTKFLGDGVMAYFDAAAADDAIQSCVDAQLRLRRLRAAAPTGSALRAVYSGFGLAAGPVVEGSLGSSVKMDYTVIGEPVNTAARLEALTRILGRPILMSEAVARSTRRDWTIVPVGDHDVGHDRTTAVYALDPAGDADRDDDAHAAVARYLDEVAAGTPDLAPTPKGTP